MRLRLALLICFITGVLGLAQFFIPHKVSDAFLEGMTRWLRLIATFALVLGVGSLIKVHGERLQRRHPDWPYSAVALGSMVAMAAVGIWKGIDRGTAFDWAFHHLYIPLEATMFALLGFFVASAAYRTFRARTLEATLLLGAALIVMLGRVPLGELISPRIPALAEWIFEFPTTAAKRGILLGVVLGAVATALRILLGIDRAYLGASGRGES